MDKTEKHMHSKVLSISITIYYSVGDTMMRTRVTVSYAWSTALQYRATQLARPHTHTPHTLAGGARHETASTCRLESPPGLAHSSRLSSAISRSLALT